MVRYSIAKNVGSKALANKECQKFGRKSLAN